MKDTLNLINNPHLIKLDNIEFFWTETQLRRPTPVDSYYLVAHSLSVNLKIKLKWLSFGYYFMTSISETISSADALYMNKEFLATSINSSLKYPAAPHVLALDTYTITDTTMLKHILETEYRKGFYSENSLVRLVLKVNIVEYIMINNHVYPNLGYFE